mgnify:CR=1 FL=1
MYTRFPYNVYDSGGWRLEEPIMCGDNGTVIPGNASAHKDDWQTLNTTIQWLKHYAQNDETVKDDYKPFFVYQGMNIAHPTYRTNEYYYNQIDPNKIQIPEWPPLEDIHPCDFQSSMLKGCIPPLNNATAREYYYSKDRIRNIRRIYYAMIAEFDAMVGAYMQAVQDIGAWDNTIFVVTSDHGDLQMEHQQMYKMVPYDASSSVPLVISDGRRENGVGDLSSAHIVDTPTQLIDIYPTIMDLAGVPIQYYPNDHLDGYSLVPFMTGSNSDKDMRQSHLQSTESLTHPDFVVSQFHGMNIAMSWFLIVRTMPCRARLASVRDTDANTTSMSTCAMKLVVWGTGNEVDSQLFDLTQDPDEMVNLIHDTAYSNFKASLEQTLRTVVDYPKVALDVARYNKDSMKNWIDVMGEPDWRDGIHTKLRWDDNWNRDSHAAFQALEDWLNKPDEILPCRGDLVWPPPPPLQEMGSITLEWTTTLLLVTTLLPRI